MPVTDAHVVARIADSLFSAIEGSDIAAVEQLFSPDVVVWNSGDHRDNDRARSVRTIGWFIGTTVDRRYQVLDRRFFDGGFVQQHVLHATARSGGQLAMRVCIVIKIGVDGLITRIDEYFDPADLAPLLDQVP